MLDQLKIRLLLGVIVSVFVLLLSASHLAFAGTAALSWAAPTTNTDGTPLTNLAGYKVYYGTSSGNYGAPVNIGSQTSYSVTGLNAGTYYFAVTAYDGSGNESSFSNEVTKTIVAVPPVISGIAAQNMTATGATIVWTTDVASSSQVEYGTSVSYGSTTTLNNSLVTSHSQSLSGLQSSTLYHYRVWSVDANSNVAVSADNTFTTLAAPDTTPPVISGVTASNLTSTGAVITWSTNEAATSQVDYGPTASYGTSSALNGTLVTSHSVTLSGLTAATTYHYRVKSSDAANNLAASGDLTFTTSVASDTTPPGDPQNFTAVPGNQLIGLSWTNPPDADFVGVRIRYRTDQYPTGMNDGTLLGDFTGQPSAQMNTIASGLQNGVTYYFSASSYDLSGNYQSTAHASATPTSQPPVDSPNPSAGGCGGAAAFIGGRNKPTDPGQMADLFVLLVVGTWGLLRRKRINWAGGLTVLGGFGMMKAYHFVHHDIQDWGSINMKRAQPIGSLLVLITALCVAGCGGGGTSSVGSMGGGSGGGATGFVTLTWQQPATNTDGTPISDLAGYRVHYGTTPGDYSNVVDVGNTTSCTINQLPIGTTNYFTVTAYNSYGNESSFSNEVSKTL